MVLFNSINSKVSISSAKVGRTKQPNQLNKPSINPQFSTNTSPESPNNGVHTTPQAPLQGRQPHSDPSATSIISVSTEGEFKAKGHSRRRSEDPYSKEWIWFVIPSSDSDGGDDQNELSGSIRMKEFVVDSTELNYWKKHMIVDRVGGGRGEVSEAANRIVKSPWVSIIEKIQQDLLTSFQTARDNMSKEGPVLYVPCFVIRFGKFLFYGSAFDYPDNYNKSSAVENLLRPLGKRLYTCVPDSFRETVLGLIIPKVGLDFVEEKELYFVMVTDKLRPGPIMCKCSVTEATGELNLYKIELGVVREIVVDISCLENSLDLRLVLYSKLILTSPTDDEKDAFNSLVNSAVKDSEVKGGLRWPLGKESVGDRYVVVGVWHMISKVYNNPFMRLKIRNVDRFDFTDSTGSVAQEVSLRIPELTSQLRDATMELNPSIDIVRDSLKLVWENFLSWEGSFT